MQNFNDDDLIKSVFQNMASGTIKDTQIKTLDYALSMAIMIIEKFVALIPSEKRQGYTEMVSSLKQLQKTAMNPPTV